MLPPIEQFRQVVDRIKSSDQRDRVLDSLSLGSWDEPVTAQMGGPVVEDLAALSSAMPTIARAIGRRRQRHAFEGTAAELIAAWAASRADDPAIATGEVLGALKPSPRVEYAARMRVLHGPVSDALVALAASGDARWLFEPDAHAARARVELLVWEAGAQATDIPGLGAWLGANEAAFDAFILHGARGNLRERSIAARLLSIAAADLPAVEGGTLFTQSMREVVQGLASHPERVVWVHGVRAMGRLATKLVSISSLTHAWANSSHLGQRRRSVAVLGAMREHTPAIRDLLWKVIGGETDPWSKATLGAALVDLVTSHRELWERIGRELLTTKASPEVICSMAEGLMTIHRRDGSLGKLEAAVVELARDRARGARGKNVADVQLWDSLLRDTDVYCGIDADANDLERTHDRLVSLALRQGAEHVALRAAGWPSTSCRIMQTVVELLPDVSDIRGRAAGLNLVESCARAVALRLWEPLLASVSHRPRGSESPEPTWDSVAAVQPWLQSEELDFALQRTALRVIALCVDATDLPSRHEQISARGQRAASVVRSLSHLPWLERGGKRAEARFRKAISDLLWRTMDATRRSASVPMPWAFQRFAAWWALSGGDPIVLRLLARSDPSVTNDLDDVILVIQDFQAALREAEKNPEDPSWLTKATTALERLHADDTDIASTLVFAQATFAGTGQSPPVPSAQSLRDRIEALAAIRRALWFDVNDPVQALALPNNPVRVSTDPLVDEAFLVYSDSTVDIDAVCDHWVRELGDCVAPIVKTALARVLRTHQATESLPPTARANTRSIGRYEVVEELGRSGMGVVYLVRDSATHRLFVLKQPCDPHGSPQPSQQLCDALEQEANVLRFINHVNVVGYKDEGRHEGLPFLVMDYLIGVDLEHYIQASPLTLRELKPIVADVCRGLSQLHAQNVVHSDLKPGNIFLRLDVAATDPANHPAGIAGVYEPFRFDNTLHREPSRCEVALSVLIDFGATFVREVYEMAGDPTKGRPCTPDYMAPECVDPTKPLEATSDVYSLAATVWAAMTGQGPFDHCKTLLEIMREQQTEAFCKRPRPPELSEELHVLLCRAMRYDPSLRVSLPAFAQYFKALK